MCFPVRNKTLGELTQQLKCRGRVPRPLHGCLFVQGGSYVRLSPYCCPQLHPLKAESVSTTLIKVWANPTHSLIDTINVPCALRNLELMLYSCARTGH
jgi:hypothetical protein